MSSSAQPATVLHGIGFSTMGGLPTTATEADGFSGMAGPKGGVLIHAESSSNATAVAKLDWFFITISLKLRIVHNTLSSAGKSCGF